MTLNVIYFNQAIWPIGHLFSTVVKKLLKMYVCIQRSPPGVVKNLSAVVLKVCWFFLWRGGTIMCRVSTDRHRRSQLEQGGAWRSLWTDLRRRQSEAIEEAQKDCVYTHTQTNNYIICLDPHNLETKTTVSAAFARMHRITQYHKLHGGRLHGELPKLRKQPK